MTHKLKTISPFFEDVQNGIKTFEIRKDDRNFQVGDTLELYHWDDVYNDYTGYWVTRTVTYILRDDRFLPPGYCCMSISPIAEVWVD